MIELVKCLPQYWEFVRILRNDKRVLDGFIKSMYITEEMQSKYMETHSQFYRIALIDKIPVGYVGVINDDIRICNQPNQQGKGIGKVMINECIKEWPTSFAKVKLGNTSSDKLFISVGFKKFKKDKNFTYYKK